MNENKNAAQTLGTPPTEEWLRRSADAEDGKCISVGGLVMSQTDAPPTATPFLGPYTMQAQHHGTCPDCGRTAYLPHECLPWYTANVGQLELRTRAISAEEAAELFCQARDEEERQEGRIMPICGYKRTVKVRVTDEAGRVTWWEVRGEMVPEYIAQEVGG